MLYFYYEHVRLFLLTVRHVDEQVLELLLFARHLHGRHPDGEARPRLLLLLVDQFEQPGQGAGDDAHVLRMVVYPQHRVRLTWRDRENVDWLEYGGGFVI